MRRLDLFWPTLEHPTDAEKAQAATRRQIELDDIRSAVIADDAPILIEEAHRLADAEIDRRRTAETKATIYLTVVGVLSPILLAIAPEALDPQNGWPRLCVTLALFLLAGGYLLRCGIWALKALGVQASSRLDARELIEIWERPDRQAALAKELMYCVRADRERVNAKVTSIVMAQHFATRAFAMFILAMVVRSGWKPVSMIFAQIGKLMG